MGFLGQILIPDKHSKIQSSFFLLDQNRQREESMSGSGWCHIKLSLLFLVIHQISLNIIWILFNQRKRKPVERRKIYLICISILLDILAHLEEVKEINQFLDQCTMKRKRERDDTFSFYVCHTVEMERRKRKLNTSMGTLVFVRSSSSLTTAVCLSAIRTYIRFLTNSILLLVRREEEKAKLLLVWNLHIIIDI